MLDDRDGTQCMNMAVNGYYNSVLREKYEPKAIANVENWESIPGIVSVDNNNFKKFAGVA